MPMPSHQYVYFIPLANDDWDTAYVIVGEFDADPRFLTGSQLLRSGGTLELLGRARTIWRQLQQEGKYSLLPLPLSHHTP